MIPGQDVAMIRLDQFATGATKGIEDAITKAKAAGAKKIVLDMRGNPGGYVNEAIGVASQFVGDGIVYQSVEQAAGPRRTSRSSRAASRPRSRSSSWPTAIPRARPRS